MTLMAEGPPTLTVPVTRTGVPGATTVPGRGWSIVIVSCPLGEVPVSAAVWAFGAVLSRKGFAGADSPDQSGGGGPAATAWVELTSDAVVVALLPCGATRLRSPSPS